MSTVASPVEMTVNAFQRRLDGRRRELGLSVSKLARRAGLPYSTVRRILKEPTTLPPKNEQLTLLAKAVGWEPEWLIRDAVQAWNPDLTLHIDDREGIQILVAAVRPLSDRDLRALIRAARALRNEDD